MPKCLVLCLCQSPVLFEKFSVYLAADVEDGICCCGFETVSAAFVCHKLLEVLKCCALRVIE